MPKASRQLDVGFYRNPGEYQPGYGRRPPVVTGGCLVATSLALWLRNAFGAMQGTKSTLGSSQERSEGRGRCVPSGLGGSGTQRCVAARPRPRTRLSAAWEAPQKVF